MKTYLLLAGLFILAGLLWSVTTGTIYGFFKFAHQWRSAPTKVIQFSEQSLDVLAYFPEEQESCNRRAAIILFHGGAWRAGSPWQLAPIAHELSAAGYVVFLPQYRMALRDKATVADGIEDARRFYRWIHEQQELLRINVEKLVIGGSSAGAFLSLWVDIDDPLTPEEQENSIVHAPAAYVLINPAINLDQEKVKKNWKRLQQPSSMTAEKLLRLDPMRFVAQLQSPCTVMHGTKDRIIPHQRVKNAVEALRRHNADCNLLTFPGRGHGFATTLVDQKDSRAVVQHIIEFLAEQEVTPVSDCR